MLMYNTKLSVIFFARTKENHPDHYAGNADGDDSNRSQDDHP